MGTRGLGRYRPSQALGYFSQQHRLIEPGAAEPLHFGEDSIIQNSIGGHHSLHPSGDEAEHENPRFLG
jgi:hypothetical protein